MARKHPKQSAEAQAAEAQPTTTEQAAESGDLGTPEGYTEAKLDAQTKQAEKEAAVQAKIAAKEAKAKEAAEKKAAREAAAEAKKLESAEKKAAREAQAAANKAAREARATEAAAAGRKYVGSMLSLADRVKAGVYVKSASGQLRSTDELAEALDAVPPGNVIRLGLEVLGMESNPYSELNVGQQSMNLRNKMRGAIKSGKLTIQAIKDAIAAGGLDTAKGEREAKAAAKAEREAKAAAAKAAKEAAAAAKAAAKAAKEAQADPVAA